MESIILIKESGELKIENTTPELIEQLDKENGHLCWENCENACADKCRKVEDLPKKYINEYDFIKAGFQIIDDKGRIDRFIVNECDNYKKVQPKRLTTEEKARIRRAREELRKAYFDATTLEEAYITQHELLERGDIANPRGKTPSKREIWKMQKDLNRKKLKTRGLRKSY